ncbi:MAG: 3-deoxy-7-phosphoheptulonate synthase [Candidatus Omnitrophota bacterium]
MSFKYLRKIPSANDIIAEMPVPEELRKVKKNRDSEIRDILEGKNGKFLIIMGPCSADNEDAVCEYVSRLAKLQSRIKDKFLIIPRVYTNKPRTTGEGYKGMMHQPDPKNKPNIVEGLKALRKMHLRLLSESGMSSADEMLYPSNYPYLEDILSYVAVGARSVENQQHRLTCSGLDIPVGMKNPTSGDLNVMLNSVQAAQAPHVFIYRGWEVKTSGNPLSHSILRGAMNQHGQYIPNYHYEDMMRLADMYHKRQLLNPTVLIDTNHANSGKKFEDQPRIAKEVMYGIKHSRTLRAMVKGLMIESYLVEGAQDIAGKVFGKSITDPCLGWDDSKNLVLRLAEYI